jgi:hypothetical protein
MLVHVSIGELIDKFTILLIKKSKINDHEKLNKVKIEIDYLINDINNIKNKYEINDLFENLVNINTKLWNIEDNIRIKEKNQEFDNEFIQLARSVYFTNDERAYLKNEINKKTNSNIFEVKSYENYKSQSKS